MRFRSCPPKIALALPVLGALMTPASALPVAKNRFRPDRVPLPLDIIRERASNPFFHYPEAPVELKEGFAAPEPALVPNRLSDDEILDRIYNHKAQSLHGVANTVKDDHNAAEITEAEQEPREAEDIAAIEKRSALSGLAGEDEESTQLVQLAPSVPEEEQQGAQAQVELDSLASEEESDHHGQSSSEKRTARAHEFIRALFKYFDNQDSQPVSESSQDERLMETGVDAPYRKLIAEPDHFDGYVELPITQHNTATVEGVEGANIDPFLLNRFKPTPATAEDTPDYEEGVNIEPFLLNRFKSTLATAEDTPDYEEGANIEPFLLNRFKPAPATAGDTPDYEEGANIEPFLLNRFKPTPRFVGDTPDYAVPAHLLPENLLNADEEDLEESLERRTVHRLATLDIKADESAPAAVPEASTAEAEAPASPSEVAYSTGSTYLAPTEHVRIARPVIQN